MADVDPVPRSARVLGAAGRFLITAGIVVFLFVAYELWGTNIQEARAQSDLRSDFDERLATAAVLTEPVVVIDAGGTRSDTPEALPTPSSTLPGGYDPEVLELFFPPDGEALARIEIPTLDVAKVVVRGTEVADLRRGPGHYSSSPLPGNAGNTSIAGHRTTYGAPFNRIDELVPGDEIVVTGVQGEFTYRVMEPRAAFAGYDDRTDSFGEGHVIVRPGASWVLGDFGDDRLTLTACHPKLSARQRIIVAAELVDEPVVLPDWAVDAQAELVAADAPDVAATDDAATDPAATDPATDDPVTDDPATDDPASDDPSLAAEPVPDDDLDGGLSGERDALPGAVLWLLLATACWVGAGAVGRRLDRGRWGRVAARAAGLVPALICLWFAFERIDRALPAA